MEIYVKKDGLKIGPFSESIIRDRIKSGDFTATSLAWTAGLIEWCHLGELLPLEPSESVTPISPLRFALWPPSQVGGSIAAFILVCVFLITITGGLFGALFNVGFSFLILTGIRYGLYRLRPPKKDEAPPSTTASHAPLWRHPVTIAISACCLLFLFLALQTSNDSSEAKQQIATSLQQNEAAYNAYNSTGRQIGRFVEGAAHGYVGDYAGGLQIDKDVNANNAALAAKQQQLQGQYSSAASSGDAAGAIISAVVFIFVGLGAFLLFQRFKNRWIKKSVT